MSFETVIYKELYSTSAVTLTFSDQTLLSFTSPITALYEIDFQGSFSNAANIDVGCEGMILSLYVASNLIAFSSSHYGYAGSSEYSYTQCAASGVMVNIDAGTSVSLRAKLISGGSATSLEYERAVKLNYVARQKVKSL